MLLQHTAKRECKLLLILRQEMQLSSGLVKRLKFQNALLVNGAPVHTDFPVRPGDAITVRLEDAAPDYPAEGLPLDILYEDAAILAVDKPAGLIIHPTTARITGTLANRVIAHFQKQGQPCAFHPVTRLDRDTFGVVLLAKDGHCHARLCDAMQRGLIHKTYRALVFGAPADDYGVIDAPIVRPDPMRMLRAIGAGGKPAQTRYTVLARRPGCALLQLQPLTGRTHQLRLHCLHAGFPILGDPQYYTEASLADSRRRGLSTQLLCAASLTFPHPLTGQEMTLSTHLDRILADD
ncbi:MAG: RluA family pseudouridine synthase [Oscillospiraceae bacterium]|nr:RluA family pseudouridine synthase [Oscillospiraceae bacterium]